MRKIEQKLLESFRNKKELSTEIDTIQVNYLDGFRFGFEINYFNYHLFTFCKKINSDGTEIIYFCLPSYDDKLSHTTKSRINTFLAEYGLKISQKNYCYYCNDKEIELDKVYFIIKDDKGNYNIK